MRTIAHVYQSYSEATRVVEALEAHGIPHSDISIVSGDKSHEMNNTGTHSGMTSGDPEQGAETGAGTGASIGTVLGGGAGLLAGIGALAIPGVGPLVAAGWLVAAITGAGVGAAAGGLLGSLTGAGISEADARTYDEGVQAGGTLVTVRVDEGMAADVERVMGMSTTDTATMATTGMDTGYVAPLASAPVSGPMATTGVDRNPLGVNQPDGTPGNPKGTMASRAVDSTLGTNVSGTNPGGMTGTGTTRAMGTDTDTIQVVKEDLAIGKRAVEGGGVKVTSHVVETPVEEQVKLHQEEVHIERHPVNERVAGTDAFRDQTISARAMSEEAVVAKEARVVEEIGIRKEAHDTTQTVRDTVRETKVDIEDTTGTRMAGTTATGTTGTTGTGKAGVPGSDPNPLGMGQPDGTPGNPKGTVASRAVDGTLGTNISGTNPGHKS